MKGNFFSLIIICLKYIFICYIRGFSPGKLTFWNFKWLKLDWLNIVHQVRHLFCGHSLTPSSPLEAWMKITFLESTLYYWKLFSQGSDHVTHENRKSSLLFWRWLLQIESSLQEEGENLTLPKSEVGWERSGGNPQVLWDRLHQPPLEDP